MTVQIAHEMQIALRCHGINLYKHAVIISVEPMHAEMDCNAILGPRGKGAPDRSQRNGYMEPQRFPDHTVQQLQLGQTCKSHLCQQLVMIGGFHKRTNPEVFTL